MAALQGIFALYLDCIKLATLWLRTNWILLPGVLLAYVIWRVAAVLFTPLGMVGGMLLGILETVLITIFYAAIDDCIRKQRLTWSDFKRFDVSLFFAFISVSFILWLVEYVLRSLIIGLNAGWIVAFFKIGVLFAFNPLPEVVYRQRVDGIEAFNRAFVFTRDNLIIWYLPFLLLIAPWLTLGSYALLIITASTYTLVPASIVFITPNLLFPSASGEVAALIGLLAAIWYTVFRGFLFEQLETGSLRRYEFMRKMR